MIAWRDGLERGPDGPARQVPTRHVWNSTVWVTKDGTARRRFFNPISGEWNWAPEMLNGERASGEQASGERASASGSQRGASERERAGSERSASW